MPFNTRNPIPSGDLRDLDDNARNIDTWANDKTKLSHPDRFGVERRTWHGIEQEAKLNIQQAIDAKNAAQEAAMMSGFSKYADTLAQLEAGIGTDYLEGDVVMVFQDESRDDTSSIFKIESGVAEFKLTFDKTRQDLLSFTGAISADAEWSDVPAHSDPAFDAQAQALANRTEFLSKNIDESIQFVTPEQFGAIGGDKEKDTPAILAALAASKYVWFGNKKYCMSEPFITNGHTVIGFVGETFSSTGTVIEFDFSTTPSVQFAVRNIDNKSVVENIRFIQKSWVVPVNGLRIDRTSDYNNCEFSYFNGYGIVLESNDSSAPVPPANVPRSCYCSTLRNVTCDYNAKHGVYLGGSANAVLVINPRARWNGSPSYGVQPTVAGDWDGIFSDGSSEFPGNGLAGEPQGTTIINPEAAYNSRYGINLHRFFDGTLVGGYGEVNLVGDIRIATVFGSVIDNFMSKQAPVIAVPDVDPLNPSTLLSNHPNRIVIRGYDYGSGQPSSATPKVYRRDFIAQKTMRGTDGILEMGPSSAGGVIVQKSGGDTITFDFTDVQFVAQRFNLGTGALGGSATNNFSVAADAEGTPFFNLLTGAQWGSICVANGSGANTAPAFLIAPKNSTNGRSINAGGTVNAAGADYAEYEFNNGIKFAKGDIVGFKADGTLTNKFSESVRFGIKSTNPSMVGGDVWFTEEMPELTKAGDEPTEQEVIEHNIALSNWKNRLENARENVDRIAYCGKVPCNIYTGQPGDFVIPVEGADGTIAEITVATPNIEQFLISVGRISRVLHDGRREVVVK